LPSHAHNRAGNKMNINKLKNTLYKKGLICPSCNFKKQYARL